ncbi:T9SS type A sorting domain-containing protein [Polluticoccus soli]|uniref:T9SS type A sorting domain-containing protein n=1 Tax=Polluticoccus soli TaxID=3034150 RepID=UPI0023E0EBDE|nr:T9SS type A sorting domain-containing protein [Flavipsychrobacter sp. JY13-12]
MNTRSIVYRMKVVVPFLVLGFVCAFNTYRAYAQFATAAAYPFTASQKPFNYLVGGTPATTANTSSWDDTYTSPAIPIGFTFTFCNVPYTTVVGHTNGYMSFGTNNSVVLSPSASSLSTIGPCMMAGWHDAWGNVSSSAITYKTTGTAPNRVFTLEFKNWASFSAQSPLYITYQYILYEGGPLELMYKQEASGQFFSAAIGIGRNSTDYQSLPNTSASPVPSSSTFTASLSATPATGQSYLWGQIPCTGTPTTSVAGPNEVCPNKPFGQSLAGLAIYSGFSFQWQTSVNGTTWTNWTGTVSPTGDITDVISSPKWYRATVTCIASGQSFTTAPKHVTIAPFYFCYCEGSKATTASGLDIGNVKVITDPGNQTILNNGSGTPFLSNANANKTYTDFRSALPPVPMYHDSTYHLFVQQISSASSFSQGSAAIFIDYNRNGVFDPWERVLQELTSQSLPNPGLVRDTFTVPDTAGFGITGMRVVLRLGNVNPDTCASYTEGETEDYLVDIRHRPCDGASVVGTIQGDTSMCIGYDYVLTDTTYQKERNGLSRLWQRSADAIGWVNIPTSADQDTLMRIFTGQPLFYRMRMVCSHTNDTGYTPVHKVNLKPTYKCYCFSQSLGGVNDTSDVGGFAIYNFANNDGGAHLGNPRAVHKRQDLTDLQPIEMWVDSIYQFHVFHTMPTEIHSDAKITVFADFNNNHQYDIPDERIFTGFTNVGYHTLISNVVIPNAAIVDAPTGLRVIVNNNVGPNTASDEGCGTYISGETEDYMLIFRRPFNVSVNNTTADLRTVQVYPNPSNGKFTVDFYSGNTIKEVKFRVMTVTGQQVFNDVYSHNGGRFTKELNLESQAKGVYFVEIDADGIKETKRLILK